MVDLGQGCALRQTGASLLIVAAANSVMQVQVEVSSTGCAAAVLLLAWSGLACAQLSCRRCCCCCVHACVPVCR